MTAAVVGPTERGMRADAPRRVIVWRHGETEQNRAGIFQGLLDTELSDVGRVQAAAAAARLAAYEPVLLLSSDLKRAAATAQELAAETGLPVHFDSRLREIDVGVWQGKHGSDVRAEFGDELDAIARGEDLPRGTTGETVSQVAARTLAAAQDLISALAPGQTGVIATHGVAGRTLACALVGIDQTAGWLGLAGLHNCHWVEILEGVHSWRIERWNAST